MLLTRRVFFILSSVFGFPRSIFRWSKTIEQLNLLRCSLSPFHLSSLNRIVQSTTLPDSTIKLTEELRKFIFKELVVRSNSAKHPKDVEELCSARGSWVLDLLSRNCQGLNSVADTFKPWISDVDYEESFMLWHIATTLCYYTSEEDEEGGDDLRAISKIISDYLLRLPIMKPQMMPPSAVVPARMIFNDTCAEAIRFFRRAITPRPRVRPLRKVCEKIMQVDTDVIPPRQIRGGESKALLFDACHLAKTLRGLTEEKQINEWEIISRVWAELLFYTAAHSSPTAHLETLQTGGELLTLVWLLMAHLGLGKHFRHRKGTDTRAELVILKH